MIALVIDDQAKETIKEIVVYAIENTITLKHIRAIRKGLIKPAGDNPKRMLLIERGFKVVFTFEQRKEGLFRHISISHNNTLPPVHATEMIIKEFGFGDMCYCHIYKEETEHINSINIIETVNDDKVNDNTYTIGLDENTNQFFKCHRCSKTSYNGQDIINLWCGNCKLFHLNKCILTTTIIIYTITQNTKDFGREIVCREHHIIKGENIAKDIVCLGDTIEDVREKLLYIYPALTNLGREALDDPVILESWI